MTRKKLDPVDALGALTQISASGAPVPSATTVPEILPPMASPASIPEVVAPSATVTELAAPKVALLS